MEHTFEKLKYNVLDDGSTLYHIYITSAKELISLSNYNFLLYQYNGEIYYALLHTNHKIFDDFYNIKPIRIEEYDAFDITINGLIINKNIKLYPYCSNPNTITYYIQNNQHLLDIGNPYVLK